MAKTVFFSLFLGKWLPIFHPVMAIKTAKWPSKRGRAAREGEGLAAAARDEIRAVKWGKTIAPRQQLLDVVLGRYFVGRAVKCLMLDVPTSVVPRLSVLAARSWTHCREENEGVWHGLTALHCTAPLGEKISNEINPRGERGHPSSKIASSFATFRAACCGGKVFERRAMLIPPSILHSPLFSS